MKTILITGGSGMIGRRLSELLIEKGYRVIWLSRERYVKAAIPRYRWDYRKGEIDSEALEQADIIIHLSGSNLGEGTWTRSKKQTIVESRVLTTRLLLDTLKKLNKKPEAFISASAVGYYGMHTDEKVNSEDDLPARNDFLSRTCKKWETEAFNFKKELGVRTVALRTPFVIYKNSPAFNKLKLLVKFGLGAPIGSGKQYFSWIHLDDLCGLYIKSVEDVNMEGVYNAVSPDQTTNTEFMRYLAKEMNRPFFLPNIPAFMLKLVMGEASGMVLEGSRISSQKVIDKGYRFKFDSVKEAFINSI
ncbi:MAG: TIGR01777 family oxidoreductase [Fermentimonas sp.]|nr:TIGR01777 family oxidoreductase [Fermentimonas sp.]